MPDIHIVRDHGVTLARAKEVAQRVADDLAREYDLVTRWVGNALHFQRSGVQGVMRVDDDRIDLEVTLGFLLKAFRSSFVHHIEREFDARLAKAPAQPAAAKAPANAPDNAPAKPLKKPARKPRTARSVALRAVHRPAQPFRSSISATYCFIASLLLSPLMPFHASHLARPTMSVKPGREPSTSPLDACL